MDFNLQCPYRCPGVLMSIRGAKFSAWKQQIARGAAARDVECSSCGAKTDLAFDDRGLLGKNVSRPILTHVAPACGRAIGGDVVTVYGLALDAGNYLSVLFDGVPGRVVSRGAGHAAVRVPSGKLRLVLADVLGITPDEAIGSVSGVSAIVDSIDKTTRSVVVRDFDTTDGAVFQVGAAVVTDDTKTLTKITAIEGVAVDVAVRNEYVARDERPRAGAALVAGFTYI